MLYRSQYKQRNMIFKWGLGTHLIVKVSRPGHSEEVKVEVVFLFGNCKAATKNGS